MFLKEGKFIRIKRGQVTIFIIIAILVVALASVFFIFKDDLIGERIPSNIEVVHNTLVTCLEEDVLTGISILESQGGYIYLPELVSGSEYMPFSSQLDFLGNPIPYWYYVSGNNLEREQVPSKIEMQNQLSRFVEERIDKCLFDNYYANGFEIVEGVPNAVVNIQNNQVLLNLDMDFSVAIGSESSVIREHRVAVDSDLGELYASALRVYEQEQEELFLETYALDTLRLYAPVDGVELTCSPKIWNADRVFDDLQTAIEANTLALKNKGDNDDYFALNLPINNNVRFLTSRNWTNSFEVLPSDGNVLIANPIGNQPGLGILGFCYVPYHFVYSVKYPVLVQIYSGSEFFQFPLAVIIDKNKQRKGLIGDAVAEEVPELCLYKNTLVNVNVFDSSSNPINAEISYECFATKCNIGTAVNGNLAEEFPQCVNGYILAKADGFMDSKLLYSTMNSGSATIYMERLHELNLQLKLDNNNYNGEAIIYFVSDGYSRTVSYPEQKTVQLSSGDYEVQVYIYRNSTLELGATTVEQCVDVPTTAGSLLGIDITRKECFNINYPAQVISSVLSGGGKQNYTFSESSLGNSVGIEINSESISSPRTLEELQNNYISFETKTLEIAVK